MGARPSDAGRYDVVLRGCEGTSTIGTGSVLKVMPPPTLTGPMWVWGWNLEGQLGNGTALESKTPVHPNSLSNIVAVASGFYHTLALKPDGRLLSFGDNQVGQMGNGTFEQFLSDINPNPEPVTNLTSVTTIACGDYHSLALKCDGTVWFWGQQYLFAKKHAIPILVTNLSDVIAIAGAAVHSLAAKADGTVWAWGQNDVGQLGDGTQTEREQPVRVGGLNGVIAISTRRLHNFALKADRTVWAWGNNSDGQLGDGTSTNRSLPVKVSGLTDIVAIAAGGSHGLALKADGRVWAWGNNLSGQLALEPVNVSTQREPRQVAGLTNVVAIAAGFKYSLAVTGNGQVWAWGSNFSGQLGNDVVPESSVPLAVKGVPNAFAIAAGDSSSFALTGNGSTSIPNPPPALRLNLATKGNRFELSWTEGSGVLEQADALTGPWSVVNGTASPFTPPILGAQRFYRLRGL